MPNNHWVLIWSPIAEQSENVQQGKEPHSTLHHIEQEVNKTNPSTEWAAIKGKYHHAASGDAEAHHVANAFGDGVDFDVLSISHHWRVAVALFTTKKIVLIVGVFNTADHAKGHAEPKSYTEIVQKSIDVVVQAEASRKSNANAEQHAQSKKEHHKPTSGNTAGH